MVYFGESYNEDRELEREYEEYMERQYEEYMEKCSEDWAYENVILPEHFEALEMENFFWIPH